MNLSKVRISVTFCTAAAYARSTTRRYFFFFQAEYGIRSLYVTGVQTCALPISGEEGVDVALPVHNLDAVELQLAGRRLVAGRVGRRQVRDDVAEVAEGAEQRARAREAAAVALARHAVVDDEHARPTPRVARGGHVLG